MALILIVEDNETIADSLSFFVKNFGRYNTLGANSAEVAYDTLRKGVIPDLIILDIRLPGMDGIDFLSKIHRDTRLKKIKVIIHSSLPVDKVREDLEKRNIFIHHILEKPSSPGDLIATIQEALKENRKE
jgi:chemosensory pili system protein ChpA (sensor histidine kinase/response regulator)